MRTYTLTIVNIGLIVVKLGRYGMKLLGISDLCERWCYTKSGIHKLVKSKNFPPPIDTICRGRIKIFREEDILDYEKNKPWLFDENQKVQRQKLYARLQLVKEDDNPNERLKKIFGKNARCSSSAR